MITEKFRALSNRKVPTNAEGTRESFNEIMPAIVTMGRAMKREEFSPAEKEEIRKASEALAELSEKVTRHALAERIVRRHEW